MLKQLRVLWERWRSLRIAGVTDPSFLSTGTPVYSEEQKSPSLGHPANPEATMATFYFRCSFEVEKLGRHLSEAGELEFRFDKPRPSVVRLTKSHWDGQKPADAASAICASETTQETADDKTSSEINLSLLTSSDGKWVNLQGIDPSTVAFLHGILDDLYSTMISTVAIFRWRCGLAEGPPNPVRNLRGYCSNGGESWREVSMARSVAILFGIPTSPLPPADVICKEVVELIKAGTQEPLGRQLFLEAWSERQARPSSALVIGVAAAEVGIKKLIGSLVPQAQWLVDEIQTPPLGTMLRKFLPTLPVKSRFQGKSISPPKVLLNQLDEAVKHRNKLVHAGRLPPSREELEKMLRAINDFLWICDVYAGHGWAHEYISAETLTAWPNEPPPKT